MNRRKLYLGLIISVIIITLFFFILFSLFYQYPYRTEILLIGFSGFWVVNAVFGLYLYNSQKRPYLMRANWLFILIGLPIIGIILFLICGLTILQPRKHQQFFAQENKKYYAQNKFSPSLVDHKNNLFNYFAHHYYSWPSFNHFSWDDQDWLERFLQTVDQAQETIFCQFSQIKDGQIFTTIFDHLITKSKQGIKVVILYDFYATKIALNRQIKKLGLTNNLTITKFSFKNSLLLYWLSNQRLQGCYVIVDQTIVFTGQWQIEKKRYKALNYSLSGPIVQQYLTLFSCYIQNYQSNQKIKTYPFIWRPKKLMNDRLDQNFCQLMCFDQTNQDNDLNTVVSSIIYRAKKSIKIICPFFLPTDELIRDLTFLNKKNIQIDIIFSAQNKHTIANANNVCIQIVKEENSINFYRYPFLISATLIIVDDEICLIGQKNVDYRSFYSSFENALLLEIAPDHYFLTYWKNVLAGSDLVAKEKKIKIFNKLWFYIHNIFVPSI